MLIILWCCYFFEHWSAGPCNSSGAAVSAEKERREDGLKEARGGEKGEEGGTEGRSERRNKRCCLVKLAGAVAVLARDEETRLERGVREEKEGGGATGEGSRRGEGRRRWLLSPERMERREWRWRLL